jgi:hypothetical protein
MSAKHCGKAAAVKTLLVNGARLMFAPQSGIAYWMSFMIFTASLMF